MWRRKNLKFDEKTISNKKMPKTSIKIDFIVRDRCY